VSNRRRDASAETPEQNGITVVYGARILLLKRRIRG
jgi:hypothetical protein